MTVTQRLMRPGDFDLRLDESTPEHLLDWPLWSHVVITPSKLANRTTTTDAFMKAIPGTLYTGVVTERPDRFQVRGHDLSWWWMPPLGPNTRNEPRFEKNAVSTVEDWLDACVQGAPNGLTKGTCTSTGLTAVPPTRIWGRSLLEVLDAVCLAGGAEWRVNPNGTIDVARPSTLHRSTPQVIITDRIGASTSATLRAVELTDAEMGGDATEVATEVAFFIDGVAAQGPPLTATPVGVAPVAWGSTAPQRSLRHDERASLVLTGDAALNRLEEAKSARIVVKASSSDFIAARFARPGDWVFVDSMRRGIKDPTQQVIYGGQAISPAKLRLYDLSWPVRNVGVYVRRGVDDWIDLTDYVVPDTGDTRWGVGRPEPRLGTGLGESLSPEWVQPSMVATPTPSEIFELRAATIPSIGAAGIFQNSVTRVSGVAFGTIYIEFGGAGVNAGNGVYEIYFPPGLEPATSIPSAAQVGEGHIRRSATNTARKVFLQRNGNLRLENETSAVSHDVPWTWAAGDRISINVMYLVKQ